MITIRVHSFDALDLEAYASMQRQAFDELLAGSGVSNAFMKPDFYLWKYDAPAGKSRIALAMDGNTILASNAMVPYVVRSEGCEYIGWQSVDTATVPKARGKGLFLQCARALREDLASDTLFFGYPNKDSLRGFQRLGWVQRDIVDVWLSHSWWPGSAPVSVHPVNDFDAGFDGLTYRLTEDGSTAMVKNAAFMRWRFNACPVATYESFAFYSGHEVRGVLVVREAKVKGRNICLVMELQGESRAIRRALAAKADKATPLL
jgi:hypothetical protein